MGYRTCPYCGANLDPDEKCDCREEEDEDSATAIVRDIARVVD